MSEDAINLYLEELRLLEDYFIQYDAMIDSARSEVVLMEKELNARLLSRMGFVFQEIMDHEERMRGEIATRSIEISNEQCIQEVTTNLNSLVNETSAQGLVDNILSEVGSYRFILMYPTLTQVKRMVSMHEYRPFNLFRVFNSVTQFERAVTDLIDDFEFFNSLFDPYVDELIDEMTRFLRYTNQHGGDYFRELNEIESNFISSIDGIRNELQSCS